MISNMIPIPFLDAVARAYVENFDRLADFCFIFPNKRAGTFFLRSLNRASDRIFIAPKILSISEFAETLSGRETASRIDLLFRLYNIYRRHIGKSSSMDSAERLLDFEAFRSWGETLIADFSETDQYVVDADALFANVSDYREISSNFLSEEQIRILEQYFGHTPSLTEVEGFWKKVVPEDSSSDIKSRFLYLWQMMAPLYHLLNDELAACGLATQGGIYRLALEKIRESGRDALPWQKIIFVGFNALSTSEALIFDELRSLTPHDAEEKISFADFYWDATGPVLESDNADAAAFLRLNKKNFPSPAWARPYLQMCRTDRMPDDMRIIAAPSNSAQAKLAAAAVARIQKMKGEVEKIKDARVAVVLPDENLLLPLLYALPESLTEINLTMGYSLKLTSAASFLHHLRRLLGRSRNAGGEISFYHEDLSLFISHPFSHILFGTEQVADLNSEVLRRHMLSVKFSVVKNYLKEKADLLLPQSFGEGVHGAIAFLDNLLDNLDKALAGRNEGVIKSKIDRSHVSLYRDAIRRLELAVDEHGVEMGLRGVFYLVDRLLAGEKVTFEGKPLEGLQVMGLLETRALDFEHLIILSLNDSIMPRRARRATFIPDSLRRGYGLPYANYQERLFAYYFYRMISRASSVTFIYDARAGEGMRSGGESRYLLQLQYLFAPDSIRRENYRFMLSDSNSAPSEVKKTPAVMEKIMEFAREGSQRNFSASALRKYGECQVKFYYETIANLRTDSEPAEFIDAITQGNIIHYTMLQLYFPDRKLQRKYLEEKIVMRKEDFERILDNEELIRREVRRAINKEHFKLDADRLDTPLDGAAELVAGHLTQQVKDIIAYDLSLAPVHLAGGEADYLIRWEFEEGKFVNMKFAIDRIDILNPESTQPQIRIVDYKTGASHVKANSEEDIFNGEYDAKNIFQLFLYANLLNRKLGRDDDIKLSIYEVNKLNSGGETPPSIGKERIKTHRELNEWFLKRLNEIISEIFNPEIPFLPTDNEDNCRLCKIRELCGKK